MKTTVPQLIVLQHMVFPTLSVNTFPVDFILTHFPPTFVTRTPHNFNRQYVDEGIKERSKTK